MRLLLDTNAIVALLSSNPQITGLVETADEIFISVINELEFRSFTKLSSNDVQLFGAFLSAIDVFRSENFRYFT